MNFVLGGLNLLMPALMLMLFVGLMYFGFAIIHFETTQLKNKKLNTEKLNTEKLNTESFIEGEIYDWSKDPGFLEEHPKDLHNYYDQVRGVWLENPYFDINDTYEYERYTSE